MAKTKKNRKSTVDLIKKVSKKQASQNPFEVHVNKAKFNVLGQRSKNDVGLPGVSRSKAIQKRKVTLLQEYKLQDKANKFYDRRIGEHNKNMTKEDKIMARFTAEKMRAHNKQTSLFNLDDDVVLTHQGRTLEEIEQFEDPRSDDEDDQDGRNMKGTLDSEFVKEAHFGGGTLSVAAQDGELNRKDLISQLIADSKKRKAEKQQLKESTMKLTEQLDSDWKDLLPLLHPSRPTDAGPSRPTDAGPSKPTDAGPRTTAPAVPPKPAVDKNSFDFLVKELRFEATGKPSDKLKSEEEMIRQEKHKLEQLERERLKRMHLHESDSTRPRAAGRAYKSADDLDDGFVLENVDGESDTSDKDEQKSDECEEETDEDENEESDDEEEGTEEDDDTMEEENVKNPVGKQKGVKRKLENEETHEEKIKEDSENDKSADDDDATEEGNVETPISKQKGVKRKLDVNEDTDEEEEDDESDGSEDDDDSFDDLVENEDSDDSDNEESDSEQSVPSEGNVDKTKRQREKSSKGKLKETPKEVGNKEEKTSAIKSLRFSSDNQPQEDEEQRPAQKGILKNVKNANEDVEMKNIESKDAKTLEEDLKQPSDLPFTFEVPKEYEELCELLDGRALCDVRTILERMVKVNHWSLGGDNKAKLNQVFAFLLQYLDDSVDASEPKRCWQVLNTLSPTLFELCLMDPDSSGNYLRSVVQEKYQSFSRRETRYPTVHSLLFLKLVSTLFPTSDARHYVTTPALIFLCHALGRGSPVSTRDVSVGVFLATLCVEYIDLSKRYLPELINFLQGLLLLFCHSLPFPITKPFKSSAKQLLAFSPLDLDSRLFTTTNHDPTVSKDASSNQLATATNHQLADSKDTSSNRSATATSLRSLTVSAADLCSPPAIEISTVFKVKALSAVLNLVAVLLEKYSCYDAAYLIFDRIATALRQIKQEMCTRSDSEVEDAPNSERKQSAAVDIERELTEGAKESPKDGKRKRKSKLDQTEEKVRHAVALDDADENVDVRRTARKSKTDLIEEKSKNAVETLKSVKVGADVDSSARISKTDQHTEEKSKNAVQDSVAANDVVSAGVLQSLRDRIEAVLDKCDALKSEPFPFVAKEKEKPKILRLFEPEIKPVLKFHTKGAQKEREKLLSKYKKEMKGAIREIRKDGRFLQKVKLRQQSRADEERQRKVKEILGGCANQEGEIRNLKRKKK